MQFTPTLTLAHHPPYSIDESDLEAGLQLHDLEESLNTAWNIRSARQKQRVLSGKRSDCNDYGRWRR